VVLLTYLPSTCRSAGLADRMPFAEPLCPQVECYVIRKISKIPSVIVSYCRACSTQGTLKIARNLKKSEIKKTC
jgi:hypothetical protein